MSTTGADELGGNLLKSIEQDKKRQAEKGKSTAGAGDTTAPNNPMPGMIFLGAGYDVFGKYASPDCATGNLFDFWSQGYTSQQIYDASLPQVRQNAGNAFTTLPSELKLSYPLPKLVQFTPMYEAKVEVSDTGSTSEDQKTLATAVDGQADYAGIFSAEFSARYDASVSRLSTAKYYSLTAIIRYYTLSMANLPIDPVKYLTPVARNELNDPTIDPKDLFRQYGTHYMYAVTIGSKIVVARTVDTSKTTASYDAQVAFRTSFGGDDATAGGGASGGSSGSSSQSQDSMKTTFDCSGVSDAQLDAVKQMEKSPLGVLKEGWHNPTLVDFPEDALRPIWELCSSPARQKALADAFTEIAAQQGALVGSAPDLTPLYLAKRVDDSLSYRFITTREVTTANEVTWDPVDAPGSADAEGSPALFVFSDNKPGTIPLYEWVHLNYGGSGNDPGRMRYETSRWKTYLQQYGPFWTLNSGTPVGWVYDGLETPPAAAHHDIYAYLNDNEDLPRCMYSTDSADSRDSGAWSPAPSGLKEFNLELESAFAQPGFHLGNSPPTPDADETAITNLASNVHWRVPAA